MSQVEAPGRRQLLKAGMKLFAERGFAAVGLREIAAEAGVSLGLVRTHFGSKDGLREAIDAHVLEEIRALYAAVLEHSSVEVLEQAVEDALDWIPRDRDALMYARMSLMERTPGSQALFDEMLAVMRQFVDNNARLGFLQADVDREWAAIYMVFDFIGPAVIEPFAQQAFGKSMYSKTMISERNAFMIRLFTRGFLKR
ncbi:TetR/AcrR family transcriptional regulator [Sphingosinicella microcystinivorans]|uniref:TetR/AcrR family transcriptional regulator n=1 Tax=Sphingosinicella microcystinivorans TaxID=335406 RepID=UPI0022F3BE5E|nr:TetR/AcrR family transcriptional regulator [Sphingosinicella microcystinivorans]WBX85318.1 helix-turn-helix domain containing protein [Sphingosinicella microcystinivorans]